MQIDIWLFTSKKSKQIPNGYPLSERKKTQNSGYEHRDQDCFYSVHILTVNPKEDTISIALGNPVSTVLSMAKNHHAEAAVNGGFFTSNGNPVGILKIPSAFISFPTHPRAAIGWKEGGQTVCVDRIGITRDFSLFSHKIPLNTWLDMDFILGGALLLVQEGEIITDHSIEKVLPCFYRGIRPRTAVGIRDTGEWVFVVVDWKIHPDLGGIDFPSLALLMRDLGCKDAINLDGGSSSTMVVNDRVVNNTYGNFYEEGKPVQKVANSIVIASYKNL